MQRIPENTMPSRSALSRPWNGHAIGVLWDQSLVWGLLCVDTLSAAGIPFRLIGTSDIHCGCLAECRILLVPGGWAAHKVRALGETGKRNVGEFLDRGGAYIGFCGGAGMALSSPPSLCLAPLERMPLAERLPSASGRIGIAGDRSHPAWKDLKPQILSSVWWPSQFKWTPAGDVAVRPIGMYSEPGVDFQVADLRVSDLGPDVSWPGLEKSYGINLDPARIVGHPAIIEATKGNGRLILSYAHLETPGDIEGNLLLRNLLEYLEEQTIKPVKCAESSFTHKTRTAAEWPDERFWAAIGRARAAAAELISFGEANLLWNWRKSWLLNWRRGIRGLEYGSLYVTLSYMDGLREKYTGEAAFPANTTESAGNWRFRADKLEKHTLEFCALARQLLLEEKIATQTAVVSKLGAVNERVDALRTALFGNRMNHGGLCRALFDVIDSMLFDMLKTIDPANGFPSL